MSQSDEYAAVESMIEDGKAQEVDKEASKPKPDGLEIPTSSVSLKKRKSSASLSKFEKVEQDIRKKHCGEEHMNTKRDKVKAQFQREVYARIKRHFQPNLSYIIR